MKLLRDTRETKPLEFPTMEGVDVVNQKLFAVDYGALHTSAGQEVMDRTVIERKELGDLFHSFTAQYDREKAKIRRAHDFDFAYILAIEGSASDILQGHIYWKGGTMHESKKSGLAMLRQLMSISRRYRVPIWFCRDRKDMALRIVEYFLAQERIPPEEPQPVHELC